MKQVVIIGLILILLIAAETAAQYFLEKRRMKIGGFPPYVYLIMGVLMYGIVALCYHVLLQYQSKMAVIKGVAGIGTIIAVALVGFTIFGQSLTTRQWTGLVLAVAAIALMMAP